MEPILDQGIRLVGLYSVNRVCRGFIHDGLYKKWKEKVLLEYDNNVKLAKCEVCEHKKDNKPKSIAEKQEQEIRVTGQFNLVFPRILRNMMREN